MCNDKFTVPEVFQAYYDCRKGKRNSYSQWEFEQNMERNLCQLTKELNNHSYTIGRTRAFVVTEPKYREVWAGQFRDRIVHHVLYNRIFDRFHRKFITDTYACIPERGVLYGANRVHKMMRQATEGWQKKAYVLQADLANFFVSIDKDILKELTLKRIEPDEPYLSWLVQYVIDHDPTQNPIVKSSDELFEMVPNHKSLFKSSENKGLPIGNLSSQYLANVYLNELDQFAKRTLKLRWYGRYVDDFVLIGHSIYELNEKFEQLKEFAQNNLDIRFHPNKTRRGLVHDGINFCGYILKPYRKYIRNKTAKKMKHLIDTKDSITNDDFRIRMNSYLGHLQFSNSFNLRKNLAKRSMAWYGPDYLKVTK